jgi:predicted transcriptional regulator
MATAFLLPQPLLAPFLPACHLSLMADHRNIKADARQLVEALPDTATWDDLAYEVYVRQAVETGLADADAGRTVSHDDAVARIRSRIRRAS